LADYRDHYEAIRALGADVVTLSVDTPAESEVLRRGMRLPFSILSDADRRVVKEWGVYNPRERGGIAKPAVFLIGRDGTVRYAEVDGVATRAPPSEVIRLLQAMGADLQLRRRVYLPRPSEWLQAVRNMMRP
jgi:peroxiredoxin